MAAVNNHAYRRLTGRLRLNGRSAIVETDVDSLLYLVTSDDLTVFEGCRVVVEGHLSGPDRMVLTWIGTASD
jgi:Protein of unknown function (DUF5818)